MKYLNAPTPFNSLTDNRTDKLLGFMDVLYDEMFSDSVFEFSHEIQDNS
jgi:hypothetical protein